MILEKIENVARGATPYQRGVQMCPGGISGKGQATQITVKIETQKPG